jgi:hypothetical protein
MGLSHMRLNQLACWLPAVVLSQRRCQARELLLFPPNLLPEELAEGRKPLAPWKARRACAWNCEVGRRNGRAAVAAGRKTVDIAEVAAALDREGL